MAKASGSIDLNAMKEASKVATNCLFEVTNGGVWLTPIDKKPNTDGSPVTSGNNKTSGTLINADGVGIYKDGTKVAQYGEDVTIGVADGSQSYTKFDYHSMQLFAKDETEPYFYVSDLRDKNGIVELTEYFLGNDIKYIFKVNCSVYEEISAGVYTSDDDTPNPDYTISRDNQEYTISPTPSAGALIIIKYKSKDSQAKAFTFGYRGEGTVGALSTAMGIANIASGNFSCATGRTTVASGACSHSEGWNTEATGEDSHAEGCETKAIADDCHAEGWQTTAEGSNSHAEGGKTEATYFCSHAEGYMTYSNGRATHTEGSNTQAIGQMAHAEGYNTMANGMYSHSQNQSTIANKKAQTVIGSCNIIDQSSTTMHTSGDTTYGNYAFIIGNGYVDSNSSIHRSNALAVDWNGTAHVHSIRSIKHSMGNPCSDGDAYEEILVGNMTYRAREINSNPADVSAWLVATIKALCQDHPGKVQAIFKGRLVPSAAAYFKICIYDTSTVNSSGMPQYAYGTYRQYPNHYWDIWIDNYGFNYSVLQR